MKTVSAPIILLAIILVAIIATATATFDSGLLAANDNLLKKNALQQSNHLRRRLEEQKVEEDGVDVQEDNSEVRTIA
jgi:cytochrome b